VESEQIEFHANTRHADGEGFDFEKTVQPFSVDINFLPPSDTVSS
jgi:hypothetical protein